LLWDFSLRCQNSAGAQLVSSAPVLKALPRGKDELVVDLKNRISFFSKIKNA